VAENRLKYTGITYDDILSQINDIIASDNKYQRFRSSGVAETLIEIFAGTTDILNHYIGRRADECYFDTAQLRSSVVSLSRMFGYVVNRKEPSKAYLKIKIIGDIGAVNESTTIQIPAYTKFSYGGDNFILRNTANISLKNYDPAIGIDVDFDTFKMPFEIIQGDIRETVFPGSINLQAGAPFQVYRVDDEDFSNLYGDKDTFYDGVTKVYVGQNKSEVTRYKIDRRSLINWSNINDTIDTPDQVCLIRTTPNNKVEVVFGDDMYAKKGAVSRKDNVYIEYLAVKGKSSNKIGVIGERVTISEKIYNAGIDITNKIVFELNSNIVGGGDDEDIESIKYSAPKIYYSLDRLVSKQDYIAYLRSLNTPIKVKNAFAWGEQEERDRAKAFAIHKMFNVALFTIAGSLYNLDTQPYRAKIGDEYDDVVIDMNYNPNAFQTQGYFNIFVMQKLVEQIKKYQVLTTFDEISGEQLYATNSELELLVLKIKEYVSLNNGTVYINFRYGSKIHENSTNIESDGFVIVNGLNSDSIISRSGDDYIRQIVMKINDAFVGSSGFVDRRGNSTENSNYDHKAFVGRGESLVNYVDLKYDKHQLIRFRFNELIDEIDNVDISPCYITTIYENEFTKLLKFNNKVVQPISETYDKYEMNGKITNIISEISKRSQVNVKSVYTSPIIHRVKLCGTVYIKPMFDKIKTLNEIYNSIYSWLDLNADFNKSIYLSNVIENIESHTGVIHADVHFIPEKITNNSAFYSDTTKDIFAKYSQYGNYDNDLYRLVSQKFEEYKKTENNHTERTFYNFVGRLYSDIKKIKNICVDPTLYFCGDVPNYYKFIGEIVDVDNSDRDVLVNTTINTDFAKVCEQMYRDDKYHITKRLINTKGNIADEYNNGVQIHGYSLGSEIVQIILEKTATDTENVLVVAYK